MRVHLRAVWLRVLVRIRRVHRVRALRRGMLRGRVLRLQRELRLVRRVRRLERVRRHPLRDVHVELGLRAGRRRGIGQPAVRIRVRAAAGGRLYGAVRGQRRGERGLRIHPLG